MSKQKSEIIKVALQNMGLKFDGKLAHFKKAIEQVQGGKAALVQFAGLIQKTRELDAAKEAPNGFLTFDEVLHLLQVATQNMDKQKFSFESKVEVLNSILDEVEKDFKAEDNKIKALEYAEAHPESIATKRPVGARPVPLKKEKALANGENQPAT